MKEGITNKRVRLELNLTFSIEKGAAGKMSDVM